MKTIDFSYFIERYLAGEMNESEKEWFAKELEGNENLRKEVELRRRTDDMLRENDLMRLREKLNKIEKTRREAVPVKRHAGPIVKYAALVAGIIIIAGSLLIFKGGQVSNEEILDQYYKPYEPVASTRSVSVTLSNDYNLAIEYYKVQDYRNAAIYFSKVITKEPDNMGSTLMNGISNFEIRNYPEAKKSFGSVIDNNNNLYIDHAMWYLALCYIRTGEQEKARQELLAVEKSGSIYKKRAQAILRKMK